MYIYIDIHIQVYPLIQLYTSIPNYEGIAAVKQAHENYQQKTVATKLQ